MFELIDVPWGIIGLTFLVVATAIVIFYLFYRALTNEEYYQPAAVVIPLRNALICETCNNLYGLSPATASGCPTCGKQSSSWHVQRYLEIKAKPDDDNDTPSFIESRPGCTA